MEHFVTLFDSGFLLQGLALYRSLVQQGEAFTLWVICMDQTAEQVLEKMALPGLERIPLREVEAENPRLLEVKPTRSRGEYCWTLTSFSYRAVFARAANAQRVTYVDADVCFFGTASKLFQEMDEADADVLLTEHAYSDEYRQEETAGKYCVQFLPVRSTEKGMEIISWWQDRCIEWCFNRHEDGKFGDQKYLDDWLERWPGCVHSLRKHVLTLAPWNASRFAADLSDVGLYHFHSLRIFGRWIRQWESYRLPRKIKVKFYNRYVSLLGEAKEDLKQVGYKPLAARVPIKGFGYVKLVGRLLVKRSESWTRL